MPGRASRRVAAWVSTRPGLLSLPLDPIAMIQLSPAAEAEVRRQAAREIADRVLQGINVDELQMLDLATAAAFLGLPLARAAKVLPVVEVGPRSRRVTVAAYKAFLAANTKPLQP